MRKIFRGYEKKLKGMFIIINKMDELEYFSKPALLAKGKEMGLQSLYGLKKKELIELIRNPPPPRARHTGVRRKVILSPADSSDSNSDLEELVFPTIYKASKHFNVNPGRFGSKVSSRNDETKSTIVIDGIRYNLRFESYTLKKSKD